MKKCSLFFFIAASLICIWSTAAMAEDGPPKKITTWVFQPCFDSSDAGWGKGVVPWIKAVEKATQGTVKIQLEPAGAITSAAEAFGATVAGMIDGFAGWATVYGGSMPEGMLAFGMAMGADDYKEAWEAVWGNPKYRIGEIVQKAAHDRNLHWAGWTCQGPNVAFTTFPVKKFEDFAGKKMRAGGPQALFHQAVGGSPVSLNAGDIYTAIKLGTIDGVYWDAGGMDDMAYQEVIKYATLPGWCPAQHQEIFINLDKWNALTQWQRDRINEIFKETYFETSRLHADGVEESLQILIDSGGEVNTLSDEEVARIREKAMNVVWPQVAEKSKGCAEGVKKWREFMKDKGKM